MRRMTSKPNSNMAVMEFVRNGGKVKTCKAALKPVPHKKNKVEMVEIEVELLPPALRRLV